MKLNLYNQRIHVYSDSLKAHQVILFAQSDSEKHLELVAQPMNESLESKDHNKGSAAECGDKCTIAEKMVHPDSELSVQESADQLCVLPPRNSSHNRWTL